MVESKTGGWERPKKCFDLVSIVALPNRLTGKGENPT